MMDPPLAPEDRRHPWMEGMLGWRGRPTEEEVVKRNVERC
jgi:hypothetical protein